MQKKISYVNLVVVHVATDLLSQWGFITHNVLHWPQELRGRWWSNVVVNLEQIQEFRG